MSPERGRPDPTGDRGRAGNATDRSTTKFTVQLRCAPGASASQAADYLADALEDGLPIPEAELDVVVFTDCADEQVEP